MRLPRTSSRLATLLAIVVATVAAAAGSGGPSADPASPTDQPPEWLVREMRNMANDGDWWITDNTPYKSDDEPWEQYGMEWKHAEDGNGITGRLFGLIGGEDRATFWEFRMSWDEERQEARLWQRSGAGAVGEGTITQTGNGEETEAIQTFTSPDGSTREVRHLAVTTADTHATRSFDRVGEDWVPQREYVWKKVRR